MFTFRDVVVFFAGFEFFHTLSHLLMGYFVELPLHTKFMVLTPSWNTWAIIINGIITILLLWWAARLSKKS